jgi:HEAT repeat protein
VNDDDQDLSATSSTLLMHLAQEGVETNLIDQAVWKNLDSPKVYVRYGAITVLAQLGDRRALPSLRKTLSDPEPSVRNAARDAIWKLAPETLTQSTRAQSNSKEVNNAVH